MRLLPTPDPDTRQGEPCPVDGIEPYTGEWMLCGCRTQDYEPEQPAEPEINVPHLPARWVCRDCGAVREELMSRAEQEAFNAD